MKKPITKSQIKNIGKRLRGLSPQQRLSDADLSKLGTWRAYHESSLKYYAHLLIKESLKMNLKEGQFTVMQRLKRIPSMVLKLKRFPTMQLSIMEDVAGVRVVLPELSWVYKLADSLKERRSKHRLVKVNNYISQPKKDGYRSLHLIYKIKKEPDIFIETQVRSHLQHIWATGVEVFGTLEGTSFKTGEGALDWKNFFKLLSSYFALKEGAAVVKEHELFSRSQLEQRLVQKIRDLNIIEQLNAYTSVYSSNWREERPKGRSGKFALLVLDTEKSRTTVKFYAESRLEQALKDYSDFEKVYCGSDKLNAVLVNLDRTENLERAYPNYFMNTKQLTYCISQIVLGKFL